MLRVISSRIHHLDVVCSTTSLSHDMLIWTYYNLDIRFRNPHIEPQSISEMLCVPLKISAVVVLDRLSWRCSRLQARRQSLKTSPSSPGQIAKKCTRQANPNVGSRSVRRRRCRCGCGCGCGCGCCCCCCCCCEIKKPTCHKEACKNELRCAQL